MKRVIPIIPILALVAACSSTDHNIAYYRAHQAELSQQMAWCKDNDPGYSLGPGFLQNKECAMAYEARNQISDLLRVQQQQAAHEAAMKALQKMKPTSF
ncbi:MAG: EexN family lipoprotein [Sulfuricella sp.]